MKRLSRISVMVLTALTALLLTACNGPIYSDGPGTFGDTRKTGRSRWLPSGSLRDPFKAIDGNINTSATSSPGVRGASLVIDLDKICLINMIVVEHGADEFGFANRMTVETRDSPGRPWILRASVPGVRRVTTVVFVQQELARYVRLVATVPGSRPWSVAEVYVN